MRKLKIAYLLLGIGIGIILINGLYSLYPEIKYKELSEEMILERAEELGYISLKEKLIIEKDTSEKEELEGKKPKELEEEPIKPETEEIEEEQEEIEELEIKPKEESMEIVIESIDNLSDIAKKLFDAKLIEDTEEFKSLVRNKGLDKRLIDGVYNIKYNTSYDDIINMFTK